MAMDDEAAIEAVETSAAPNKAATEANAFGSSQPDAMDEEARFAEDGVEGSLEALVDFESKVSARRLTLQIQVKVSIDLLKTPVNRVDEFQAFNESILGFIAANKA